MPSLRKNIICEFSSGRSGKQREGEVGEGRWESRGGGEKEVGEEKEEEEEGCRWRYGSPKST